MRVLIAEDDITSRSILTAIPGKWGYEVGEEERDVSANTNSRDTRYGV
jgi:hypothetical protein